MRLFKSRPQPSFQEQIIVLLQGEEGCLVALRTFPLRIGLVLRALRPLITWGRFMLAPDPLAEYRFARRHRFLLHEDTLAWFWFMQYAGEPSTRPGIKRSLALLRRCQQIGVAEAFAERLQISLRELEAAARERRPLFSPELSTELEQVKGDATLLALTGDLEGLARQVQGYEALLKNPLLSQVSTFLGRLFQSDYALALLMQGKVAQSLEAIDVVITQTRELLAAWPADAPDLVPQSVLARAYTERYYLSRQAADLAVAKQTLLEVLSRVDPETPRMADVLQGLIFIIREEYAQNGDAAVLVELGRITAPLHNLSQVPHFELVDKHIFCAALANLGALYSDVFMRSGDLDLLRAAEDGYSLPALLLPEDDPLRLHMDISRVMIKSIRFQFLGQRDDLEQAIAEGRVLLENCPSSHAGRSLLLINLGVSLCQEYQHLNPNDAIIDEALGYLQEACENLPLETYHRARALCGLANALYLKANHEGNIEGLDRAEAVLLLARHDLPETSPSMAAIYVSLAQVYEHRAQILVNTNDREKAIELARKVLATTEANAEAALLAASSLGSNLSRHAETLNEGIAILSRALEHVELGTPLGSQIGALSALALSKRYQEHHDEADIDEALAILRRLILLAQPYPLMARFIGVNLAISLLLRSVQHEDQADLKEARELFTAFAASEDCSSHQYNVLSANRWADIAAGHGLWPEAAQGYRLAIASLNHLYLRQEVNRSRTLEISPQIWGRAAAALARVGQVEEAVLVLEQGRARVLGDLRARDVQRLERLRLADPELFERYRRAAEQIDRYDQDATWAALAPPAAGPAPSSLVSFYQEEQQRSEAIRAFKHVTAEIAALPEYADLLGQPDPATIAATIEPESALIYLIASLGGTVALIVARADTGDRLAITPVIVDYPISDLLDSLPLVEILVSELEARKRAVLQTMDLLWRYVMGPVLEACHDLRLRAATLIPTGLLALLPLHAASTEQDGQRVYAADRLSISYTPSARFLLDASRRATQAADNRLVVIADPTSFWPTSPLPHALDEARAVAHAFGASATAILQHDEVTLPAVLEQLPTAHIFHAACHGRVDGRSFDAHLILANGQQLTTQDVLGLRLGQMRLAVLSACETGVIKLDLPDEMLGFSTALLFAGCAGVVTSSWSVSDLSTAMLMERFYAYWRGQRLTPRAALWQAQHWMRQTSNGQKKALYRSAFAGTQAQSNSYQIDRTFAAVMLSKIALERSDEYTFAHPYYWAPFTFNGA